MLSLIPYFFILKINFKTRFASFSASFSALLSAPFSVLIFLIFAKNIAVAQTFSTVGDTILDNQQPNTYILNVAGLSPASLDASHGLTRVCLNITHTWDSDLQIRLIAPSGRSVALVNGVGGDGDNFVNTCFTATALSNISSGTPPFSGTFKANLGTINNGADGNGAWKLIIRDAVAQDAGFLHSWSVKFAPNAAVPVPLTSNLPIMVINTNGQFIQNDPKIPATMKLIDNSASGGLNHETDYGNAYSGNIGIELRGNYSAILPQVPYAFELRDSAQNERDTSLLGMPKEHDFCLLATYNDKVFMRNPLAYKLSREMNHYAPRTRYCEMILNDNYMGVFVLSETIKRGKKRVDIAKNDTANSSLQGITGGYIFKNDLGGTGTWQSVFHPLDAPNYTVNFAYTYPKFANITLPQKNYIADFITEYETALYSSNFKNPVTGYRKYIDTRSFIDYFIIQELTRNNDGFKKSSYFHKNRDTIDGKLKAGPVWDFDWAWKNINECPAWSVTDGSGWSYRVNECGPDAPSNAWNVRLLQDTAYANELHCRWQELRQNVLDTVVLNRYIDSTAAYLNDAQARHFTQWGNLGQNTGSPEVTPQPATFPDAIAQLKGWIATRITWLDANMPGSSCVLAVNNDKNNGNNVEKISIYPNPSANNLNFIFNNFTAEKAVLKIFDNVGQLVFSTNIATNNRFSLDISKWVNGIYSANITTKMGVLSEKIVILH